MKDLISKEKLLNEFGLTMREKEILLLILDGYQNKVIAKKLFLDSKTIEWHKENIKNKLGIESIRILYDCF